MLHINNNNNKSCADSVMHYLLIQAFYLNLKKMGGTLKLLHYISSMPVKNLENPCFKFHQQHGGRMFILCSE